MSRAYKFKNPKGLYFATFTVVRWLHVLNSTTRIKIIVDSLNYSVREKGMEIIAWVIMINHVHVIFRSVGDYLPQNLLGSIKRHTSRRIVENLLENENNIYRDIMLNSFIEEGKKSSNVKTYQLWQHHNKPIELWSKSVINRYINYIHFNPVKAGLVERPEDYEYSSAIDYAGGKGMVILSHNWLSHDGLSHDGLSHD